MFRSKNVSLTIVSDRDFRLYDDIVYDGKYGKFTVKAGFVTDFASVPTMVSWLIPSYGKYTLAVIIHDDLCVKQKYAYDMRKVNNDAQLMAEFGWIYREGEGWTPPEGLTNSRDTDGLLRRMTRELEVPFLIRWLMWTGVRWGAMLNPARRQGIVRDLPLMLLVSILASPLVVPASLFVALGLGISKAFEILTGRYLK